MVTCRCHPTVILLFFIFVLVSDSSRVLIDAGAWASLRLHALCMREPRVGPNWGGVILADTGSSQISGHRDCLAEMHQKIPSSADPLLSNAFCFNVQAQLCSFLHFSPVFPVHMFSTDSTVRP